MKHIFSLFAALLICTAVWGNAQGHFWLDVEPQNISVTNVQDKFATWLDLPAKTTWKSFRDETDDLGIRHISYRQYVQGYEIGNSIVMVHAKDGKVLVVNGDIMDSKTAAANFPVMVSPLRAAQRVRRMHATGNEAELKIVRVTINGKDVFRYAYEVWKEDMSAIVYVDAETGEIIKTAPRIYSADKLCTGNTMYSGTQTVTCYEDNGKYYLLDDGRNMITLLATFNEYKIDYERIYNAQTTTQFYSYLKEELDNYIDGCSRLYSENANWNMTWKMRLTKVTVDKVKQDSKWYTSGEGTADLFIRLKDSKGNIIYTSNYYTNPTLPFTFNIDADMDLSEPPYKVEVYDYDADNDYDLIDSWKITRIYGDNRSYDWKGSLSSGTYEINSYGYQPMMDAHWGMEKTLDFYKEKLNRNSYDNKGGAVYNIVNPPTDTVLFASLPMNAFAMSSYDPYPMVYGMGFNSSESQLKSYCMSPLVSIDVMAHEFTHIVTAQNGNGGLQYLGESGALNESFSDIIGIAVKNYAKGKNDWYIGSEIMMKVSNMRSMKDPKNGEDGMNPQPDTYLKEYWEDTSCLDDTCDHGGVHTNSGVQNYWFYLLSEGGSGTNDKYDNYTITGIGIDNAVKIAYRNLIYYLPPEATYEDARNGSIQAAKDLYGKDSKAHQATMNAWYAVGVGKAHSGQGGGGNNNCKSFPFKETFASGIGDFTIQNVTLPAELKQVWAWDEAYGMVGKSYDENGKYEAESWLISPCIEIGESGKPVASFLHAAKYFSATSQMTMWISTDYSEGDNPYDAVWNKLTIPKFPSGGNWDYYESGEISLNAYKGEKVHIAFKYTSTDDYAPQWRIKNFNLKYAASTKPQEGLEDVQRDNVQCTKLLIDGQLYILYNGRMYDVQGRVIGN